MLPDATDFVQFFDAALDDMGGGSTWPQQTNFVHISDAMLRACQQGAWAVLEHQFYGHPTYVLRGQGVGAAAVPGLKLYLRTSDCSSL